MKIKDSVTSWWGGGRCAITTVPPPLQKKEEANNILKILLLVWDVVKRKKKGGRGRGAGYVSRDSWDWNSLRVGTAALSSGRLFHLTVVVGLNGDAFRQFCRRVSIKKARQQ